MGFRREFVRAAGQSLEPGRTRSAGVGGALVRDREVRLKVGRKVRIKRLDCFVICGRTPETDETVRTDKNYPSLPKPRLFRQGARACPFDDRPEGAPSRSEIVEGRRAAANDEVMGRSVEVAPAGKARSRRGLSVATPGSAELIPSPPIGLDRCPASPRRKRRPAPSAETTPRCARKYETHRRSVSPTSVPRRALSSAARSAADRGPSSGRLPRD
jgi:hypothetical protein